MVNKKEEKTVQDDIEVTNEDTAPEEPELIETEEAVTNKITKQKQTIQRLESENRELREELQRQKADFLNARRRLEEERQSERHRALKAHIEELLPLCDSFYLARQDTALWEKADATWRKGVEGIHNQLTALLTSYQVTAFDPVGEQFDHYRHEAVGSAPVTDEEKHDTVVNVAQLGYEIQRGESTELIRPARVIVGEYTAP